MFLKQILPAEKESGYHLMFIFRFSKSGAKKMANCMQSKDQEKDFEENQTGTF